ncbi:MAG: hypothetical protein DI536_28830 [Archangium gephyra]|uniref:Uncharacterized protein n=1 Tax=Archangium gephyra TaxID=48 RepID=A0A2W5UUQ2_9BACT|nr:MAG: hypothetical protein DI536_28830 [Archangium gephyra]
MNEAPITYGYAYEWTNLVPAERGLSHRTTSSSRRPGKAIEGTVNYAVRSIVRCPDCGGWRYDSPHPHSPHWRNGVQVDCIGRELGSLP